MNGQIWVTNHATGSVTRIDSREGKVVNTFAVGKTPSSITFDGFNIWVANGGSNTVCRITP